MSLKSQNRIISSLQLSAASIALYGSPGFSQTTSERPAPVVQPQNDDSLLFLQSITNPQQPFSPFREQHEQQNLYNYRWKKEIGTNTQDFIRLRSIVDSQRFKQPMTSPDFDVLTSLLDRYDFMEREGQLPEIKGLKSAKDDALFWINTGMAAGALLQPEFAPAISAVALIINAENKVLDHAIDLTNNPDEIRRAAKEAKAVLKKYGRDISDETLRLLWELGHDGQWQMFGDQNIRTIEQQIAKAFPDRSTVLPSMLDSLDELLAKDPDLKDLRKVIQRAKKEKEAGGLTPKTQQDLLDAGLDLSGRVQQSLKRFESDLSKLDQRLDAIQNDQAEQLRLELVLQEIKDQSDQAYATIGIASDIIGVFDQKSAQVVSTVGNALVKVGTGVAMIYSGYVNPISIGSIVSGVTDLISLPQRLAADDATREILRAISMVMESVGQLHEQVQEVRTDIRRLGTDINEQFVSLENAIRAVHSDLISGFNTILQSNQQLANSIDKIDYEIQSIATWVDRGRGENNEQWRKENRRPFNQIVLEMNKGATSGGVKIRYDAPQQLRAATVISTHATDTSFDDLISGRNLTFDDFIKGGVWNRPTQYSYGFFPELFSAEGLFKILPPPDGVARFPERLPNPNDYLKAVHAYLQFRFAYPEYREDPAVIQRMVRVGETIQRGNAVLTSPDFLTYCHDIYIHSLRQSRERLVAALNEEAKVDNAVTIKDDKSTPFDIHKVKVKWAADHKTDIVPKEIQGKILLEGDGRAAVEASLVAGKISPEVALSLRLGTGRLESEIELRGALLHPKAGRIVEEILPLNNKHYGNTASKDEEKRWGQLRGEFLALFNAENPNFGLGTITERVYWTTVGENPQRQVVYERRVRTDEFEKTNKENVKFIKRAGDKSIGEAPVQFSYEISENYVYVFVGRAKYSNDNGEFIPAKNPEAPFNHTFYYLKTSRDFVDYWKGNYDFIFETLARHNRWLDGKGRTHINNHRISRPAKNFREIFNDKATITREETIDAAVAAVNATKLAAEERTFVENLFAKVISPGANASPIFDQIDSSATLVVYCSALAWQTQKEGSEATVEVPTLLGSSAVMTRIFGLGKDGKIPPERRVTAIVSELDAIIAEAIVARNAIKPRVEEGTLTPQDEVIPSLNLTLEVLKGFYQMECARQIAD